MKRLREAMQLPKGALKGLDDTLTAGPATFDGSTYIALRIRRGENNEFASYQLRRWSGKTWERVAKFPVPIHALAEHAGKLYGAAAVTRSRE